MKPELIFYGGHKLTESPVIDKKNNILYFLAIRYNTIFALNLDTLSINSFSTEGPVGGITFCGNELIEAEKNGIYSIDFNKKTKKLISHIITYEKMRYNHIISDSEGRLWVDVIGDEDRCEGRGGLYLIDQNKSENVIYGTTVANGLCLSDDESRLYFTDTPSQKVWEYELDFYKGRVTNERVLTTYEGLIKPDGLFLDDNLLYITEWGGGKIDILDIETGKKVDEINFPVKNITACVKFEDNLYVTTAKSDLNNEPIYAGGLFKVRIG